MTMYKSITFSAIFVLIILSAHAQNSQAIVINQGNGISDQITTRSGEIFINVISSREDIGGVEANILTYPGNPFGYLQFKNYNDFPVSVNYEVNARDDNGPTQLTGAIVLQAGETKSSATTYIRPTGVKLISRRQNSRNTQSRQPIIEPGRTKSEEKEHPLDGVLDKIGGYLYVYPNFIKCTSPEIKRFVQNLNNKRVYGCSNWRVATPAEASLINNKAKDGIPLGTSDNLSNDRFTYNFIIVCE